MKTTHSLSGLRPEPHELKGFFHEHRITQSMLAKYLRTTPGRMHLLLNDKNKMPEDYKAKLCELRKKIEASENILSA